jgi:hypothetical protein
VPEDEAQTVFLDANVFIGAGFNMGSRDLARLEALVTHGTVRLVTTDIVVREVQANISEKLALAVSRHDKFRDLSDVAILRVSKLSRPALKGLAVDEIAADVRGAFDEFLRRTRTLILPTDDLRAGRILTDYFAKTPPFGEGKKRKEFPDAFSVAALRQWVEAGNNGVIAVTDDGGFAAAVLTIPDIEHAEKLSTALDEIYSRDEARARLVKHEILKRRDEVKTAAATAFTDRGFSVEDSWEGEVLEVRVQNVDLTDDPDDLEIVDLTAGFAIVVTRVDVDFEADLRYGDENMASYDSEDGITTYWKDIEETNTEREEDVELEIHVSFDSHRPGFFSIDRVEFSGPDTIMLETSRAKEWRDVK